MAKCSDPMLAQLSGRIGNVVFCKRGNTTYARVYAKPSNPNTDEQKTKRSRFKDAVAAGPGCQAQLDGIQRGHVRFPAPSGGQEH